MTDIIKGQVQQENYQFSAKPKVVGSRVQKFRDQNQNPTNIMWDKRVVRGNTYSSIVTQKIDQQDPIINNKSQKQQQQQLQQQDIGVEVEGSRGRSRRENQEVQTDENVEELTNKPPNYQKECQTDFIIEKEVVRIYLQPKTGVDKETQVWDDGELFNFDYEAEPILKVLVGKTLEISRLELLEEEELKEMSEQQKYYKQLNQAEMVEQERLEQIELRHYNSNIKRKEVYQQKKELSINAHQKLVSHMFSKKFLQKIIPNTKTVLRDQGLFRADIFIQLNGDFLPWLYEEVQHELLNSQKFSKQSQIVFEDVQNQLIQQHQHIHLEEMNRRSSILAEREKNRVQDEIRKEKKRQAKIKRLEMERRQKIKDTVLEKLYSKGEIKNPSINGIISDIDGNQQNQPYLGLFGGLIGELIIFFNVLNQLSNESSNTNLKLIVNNNEILDEILLSLILQLISNQDTLLEVPLLNEIEPILEQEESGLTISSISNSKLASPKFQKLLIENLCSPILKVIQVNFKQLQMNQELDQIIIKNFIKHSLTNEQIRPKIRFVKVNRIAEYSQKALIRVRPYLDELNFNLKSGKVKADGTDPDEEIVNPINLAEADIQNKTTAFLPAAEDINVLIQHSISELKLRELIIELIGEQLNLDPGQDYQILLEATDKCQIIQDLIIGLLDPKLPLLELGQF